MIFAGQLLLSEQPGQVELTPGYVEVQQEQIRAVHRGPFDGTPDAGGDNALIFPGFIDGHLHLPQFDSIGADGLTLLDWLEQVIFPAEMRWDDSDYAVNMTERVIRQLLRFGTTGIVAYATSHHHSMCRIFRTLHDSGLHGLVGQVLMDRNAPDALLGDPEQQLEQTRWLLRHNTSTRMGIAVTPRFAISCSSDLLHGAAKLAAQANAPLQTHFAEMPDEVTRVAELFDGKSYVQVYQEAGLLQRGAIFAHAVHTGPMEQALFAEAGCIVAHCPTANIYLKSGTMSRHSWRQAHVPIILGSDIAGGHERSMVRVAVAMIEAAKMLNEPIPTACDAWWQITAGNALTLGWKDRGVLKDNAMAHLLVIEPDIEWQAATDPLGMLLYGWDDRWIRQVYLGGKLITLDQN